MTERGRSYIWLTLALPFIGLFWLITWPFAWVIRKWKEGRRD